MQRRRDHTQKSYSSRAVILFGVDEGAVSPDRQVRVEQRAGDAGANRPSRVRVVAVRTVEVANACRDRTEM